METKITTTQQVNSRYEFIEEVEGSRFTVIVGCENNIISHTWIDQSIGIPVERFFDFNYQEHKDLFLNLFKEFNMNSLTFRKSIEEDKELTLIVENLGDNLFKFSENEYSSEFECVTFCITEETDWEKVEESIYRIQDVCDFYTRKRGQEFKEYEGKEDDSNN